MRSKIFCRYLHNGGTISECWLIHLFWTLKSHQLFHSQPILAKVSDALEAGSRAVIDQDDQYEVFNNPSASDPSHSMISKVRHVLFSSCWDYHINAIILLYPP